MLAPPGLLPSGNLAEQPEETAFAAVASQPRGKYVPYEASLGGCNPEGIPVEQNTWRGEAERWDDLNSFSSSGMELTSLADNQAWFYLVRLSVMRCLKLVP